jgi:hypothetical protein
MQAGLTQFYGPVRRLFGGPLGRQSRGAQPRSKAKLARVQGGGRPFSPWGPEYNPQKFFCKFASKILHSGAVLDRKNVDLKCYHLAPKHCLNKLSYHSDEV